MRWDTYLKNADHSLDAYNLKSLRSAPISGPFGPTTASLVFTSLTKKVKLMVLQQGIRLHQYLDNWLIRATSETQAQTHTKRLLSLVQDLGFIVNIKKSECTMSVIGLLASTEKTVNTSTNREAPIQWNYVVKPASRTISGDHVVSALTGKV